MIKLKRVYEKPSKDDGFRVLVDRLWPRGLKKAKAKIDLWLKDIAPSESLRKLFGHDPAKWDEFKRRYFHELASRKELVDSIVNQALKKTVTLLYGSKEQRLNNAIALKEYVDKNYS